MFPDRDVHGCTKKTCVISAVIRCQVPGAGFDSYLSRVTLLGIRAAIGDSFLPLWSFGSTFFPFRVRKTADGGTEVVSAARFHPPTSLLPTRSEIGGMNTKILV